MLRQREGDRCLRGQTRHRVATSCAGALGCLGLRPALLQARDLGTFSKAAARVLLFLTGGPPQLDMGPRRRPRPHSRRAAAHRHQRQRHPDQRAVPGSLSTATSCASFISHTSMLLAGYMLTGARTRRPARRRPGSFTPSARSSASARCWRVRRPVDAGVRVVAGGDQDAGINVFPVGTPACSAAYAVPHRGGRRAAGSSSRHLSAARRRQSV